MKKLFNRFQGFRKRTDSQNKWQEKVAAIIYKFWKPSDDGSAITNGEIMSVVTSFYVFAKRRIYVILDYNEGLALLDIYTFIYIYIYIYIYIIYIYRNCQFFVKYAAELFGSKIHLLLPNFLLNSVVWRYEINLQLSVHWVVSRLAKSWVV